MTQRFRLPTLVLLLSACTAAPALAQLGNYGPRIMPTAPQADNKQQLPPGLPGARTSEAPVADAAKPASEMTPNDALFDAINRGDLATARDALNRGAQLSATNVLGLTPLDLSIDLGRDNITFLLLSMRGADRIPGSPPSAVANAGAGTKGSGKTAAAAKPVPVKAPPPPKVVTKAPPAARYADDAGTPNPSTGFLGFSGK